MAGRLPSSRRRLKAKAEAGRWLLLRVLPSEMGRRRCRGISPGRKNFTSRSRVVTSVVHVVPYVQVSTAQLGVGGLLGVKLLSVHATV